MKTKVIIEIPNRLIKVEKPQLIIQNRRIKIPVLALTLLGIFASLAFTPTANPTAIEERSLTGIFDENSTPMPEGTYDGNKFALLPASFKKEKPSSEKSDLDFASYRYHSWDIPDEITLGNDFWIEIDLTNQILYAYRDNQLINGFKVSTGTSSYKTVTGTFKIFTKYPAITMTGPGYDLEGVPFSMFFYKGYAIHGTYWHNNFGTPMSHGCVNMDTDDAAWIYDNAPVGTYIMVHY